MVTSTAVHMSGGENHEHIASVRWRNPTDSATGENSRGQMVDWINEGGDARVSDGWSEARVGVVDASPSFPARHARSTWR